MKYKDMTDEEVEELQVKIVKEGWLPVEEKWSLHIYESRWEIDGEKYILYKAIGREDSVIGEKLEFVNKHICDCEKNYGKDCLYPEKYENGGCI